MGVGEVRMSVIGENGNGWEEDKVSGFNKELNSKWRKRLHHRRIEDIISILTRSTASTLSAHPSPAHHSTPLIVVRNNGISQSASERFLIQSRVCHRNSAPSPIQRVHRNHVGI